MECTVHDAMHDIMHQVGSFAVESEDLQLSSPELHTARVRVLDYFGAQVHRTRTAPALHAHHCTRTARALHAHAHRTHLSRLLRRAGGARVAAHLPL